MNPNIGQLLAPFALSFAFVFLLTPLVIILAKKIGIIDDPKNKTHPKIIHTYPVPRGGGLSIFAGIALTSLIFLPIDKHLIGILLGLTVLVVLGLIDDRYNINPYKRLAVQFLAAAIPIATGIGIAFMNNPFGGIIDLTQPRFYFQLFGQQKSIWILSDIFALFWMVFIMNILNMGAKGVDGQLPGVVSISALTIALLSLKHSADITQWPVIILALIISGSYLGFLPWNIFPQKIMPGFSGSIIAGYSLAVLSILSTTKVGTLLVVLGIPMVDTGYTIIRRVLSGKSPVWGDAGHLHHKLLNAGFNKKQVSYFYWGFTVVLGIVSLYLNTSFKFYTIIGVVLFVGGLLLWLTYNPKRIKK
jgi:UDP-GlcNAc:undecaprenyl-phosphate GlcNAc-1-phosphate transferase